MIEYLFFQSTYLQSIKRTDYINGLKQRADKNNEEKIAREFY